MDDFKYKDLEGDSWSSMPNIAQILLNLMISNFISLEFIANQYRNILWSEGAEELLL